MKSQRSFYVAFGISICVGLLSVLYITRRRKRSRRSEVCEEKSNIPNEEIIQEDEVTAVLVKPEHLSNKTAGLESGSENIQAIQLQSQSFESQEQASPNSLAPNGVYDLGHDSSQSDIKSSKLQDNALSGVGDVLGADIIDRDTNGNDCRESSSTAASTSETCIDGNTSVNKRPSVNTDKTAVENHKVVDTALKSSVKTTNVSTAGETVTQEITPMQVADTLMRISKPGALKKLTYSDCCVLKYTVSYVQGLERVRILETIAGAAAFSVNLPLLTASGCLKALQDLLKQTARDRRSCLENVKVSLLHALANCSGSDENQEILKTSVDDLFSLSEGQEESKVGLACLCVISNLSLTKHCHLEVAGYGTRLFELLEDEDTALLKQVLTILLNLCSESSTVPLLLRAKAPSEMETFVARTGTIGKSAELLIKWLRILRNLYKVIRDDGINEKRLVSEGGGNLNGSVYVALQNYRLHMKACVFLLCHNKESHGLASNAKLLYEYLETTN